MSPAPSISVILVDDHPIVRGGLEAMLLSEQGFRILACAASGKEALQICQKQGVPDVLVMDIRMPEMDGFQTLLLLKRHFPRIRVLFLAGMPLKHEEERARMLGARGYLSKSTEQNRLIEALRTVAHEESAFIFEVQTPHQRTSNLLTARECEVLEYLSRGHSRESIAQAMQIGQETVKSHMKSLYTKLDVSGGTEAVGRGYELGLLHP